jgi:hypothetical protein
LVVSSGGLGPNIKKIEGKQKVPKRTKRGKRGPAVIAEKKR